MSDAESLLDLLAPPENMVGHSGVLVGMTATEKFLENAVQGFTRLRRAQRAELGQITVYLMQDGHASADRQSVLPPGRVPGLHEFQPHITDPTKLLHAKMALLAFAPNRTAGPVHLRLAILTANFTYMSARHQLELAWVIDVPVNGVASAIDRTDMSAAGAFVQELLHRWFYRNEQNLSASKRPFTGRLDDLLAACAKVKPKKKIIPRFIHSLNNPLYEQIRNRFKKMIRSPRNFLLCGSGFYEQPPRNAKRRMPTVLAKIQNVGKFTASPYRIALVNPKEAGAIANWATTGQTEGWKLFDAYDSPNRKRVLHAKFIYAGYLRHGNASNGCLYLGSGNLTLRGLFTTGEIANGNVECGVVFRAEDLDADSLRRKLFWNSDAEEIGADEWRVGRVGDEPETEELIEVPPILSAAVESLPSPRLRLHWRDDFAKNTSVRIRWIGQDWQSIVIGESIEILQNSEYPTFLDVRDDNSLRIWRIPVCDTAGRVCWQPGVFDTYATALAALLDFPIRPPEDADDDDGDDDDDDGDGTRPRGRPPVSDDGAEKRYALYRAAELIEKVAALQTSIPAEMLDDWLEHLDRMLRASFPDQLVSSWREHRIDVFSHLARPELRPPQLNSKQRAQYLAILNGAALSWGIR
jgi:hypothetical protein